MKGAAPGTSNIRRVNSYDALALPGMLQCNAEI